MLNSEHRIRSNSTSFLKPVNLGGTFLCRRFSVSNKRWPELDGAVPAFNVSPTVSMVRRDVRVLTRVIARMREIVPGDVPRFPSRTRAGRKRMQKRHRMTASERASQQVRTYKQLLAITEEVPANTRRTLKATARSCGKTATDTRRLLSVE